MDVTNLFFFQSSQQHDETSSNQLFKAEKPEGDPWFFPLSLTLNPSEQYVTSTPVSWLFPVSLPLPRSSLPSSPTWALTIIFLPYPFCSPWHISARVIPKKYKSDLAVLQLKTHQSSVTPVTLRITSNSQRVTWQVLAMWPPAPSQTTLHALHSLLYILWTCSPPFGFSIYQALFHLTALLALISWLILSSFWN